jgi:hypothetical protein
MPASNKIMSKSEQLFEHLAFTTWDTILNAFTSHFSYGEDAITSVNLLTLKNASLKRLVLEDTRPTESTKGCDFEFWIGSVANGWLRYAIQAKKITSRERYSKLTHKVNGTPQIDILEKYAQANKAIPIYCLFNHAKQVSNVKTSCSKYKNLKELGCSVTPLTTVKKAIKTRGAKSFDWFHTRNETLPWSCLVRCPNLQRIWSKTTMGMDIAEMTHEKLPSVLLEILQTETSNLPTRQFDEKKTDTLVNSDLFAKDVNFRPQWIGVIELDDTKSS